jgi:hypothetical protein
MKKKKKKKQSNNILILALVGGGLLLVGGAALVVVLNAGGPARDPQARAKEPPNPLPKDDKKPPVVAPKKPPLSAIARRIDRPQRINELKQMALFYQSYASERGRPPAKLVDFTSYFQRDAPAIVQAIQEGYYEVVLNVRGNGIVAYEKDADIYDQHGVARGDGSADTIKSQELKAALQAQGG